MKPISVFNIVKGIILGICLGSCISALIIAFTNFSRIKKIETQISEREKDDENAELSIFAINTTVIIEFEMTYDDRNIIAIETKELDYSMGAYLSNVYWRYDFQNDIYQTDYISAFVKENIIVKEIKND